MKKLTLTLLCCSFGTLFFAQETGLEKRGSKLFNQYDYSASIETLEAVDQKNADILRKLAESYDMIGNYAQAEYYQGRVCESANRVPQDLIEYARLLMKNQKYELAELQLRTYETLNPADAEAQRFHLLNASIAQYSQYGSNFSVANMNMNTAQEDFAPVIYDNKLYFSSSRSKTKLSLRRWVGNDLPFLDVYVAELNGDAVTNWWLFDDKEINRKYHEGPVAFSKNGNEMFITRNDYTGKGQDGTRNLKLLISSRNGDSWSEPVELPFNSKEYSVGHAALSADGNTLVFASDMPGGEGGVDLYKSVRANGNWSTPENLSAINTAGDEMFPSLHESGVLLFSSNGHPGYGGLDLFAGQWKNNTITRFQNIGSPMNSPGDDFSAWMDPAMTHGYFSSNRKEGKGNDDIYSFTMVKPFTFGRTVGGTARDMTGILLPNTTVQFKNASGLVIGETTTADDGTFAFETETVGAFTVTGTKDNYFSGTGRLEIKDDSPDVISQDVILEKDPGFALLAVITDKKSKAPIEGVKVTLVNNMTGTQEVVETNEKGEILRPIRDKKLNDRISYNIRLEKSGYVAKGTTYNRELTKEGRYVVSDELNLGMDKMDVGLDLAKAIDLKPIYFDLAKYNIRPDAALELDKIVKVLNENPTMVVELGSHTDCRGTAAKNQELSQKRAMASADYIKQRIQNPDRIYGMGYGESKILNGCTCEGKKNPKYTEAQHQVNRRTEFLIVKM